MEIALGVLMSILSGFIKEYLPKSNLFRISFVFGLCLIAAAIYNTFSGTEVFEAFVNILVTAGAFWAFVGKHVESFVKDANSAMSDGYAEIA